jgi:hypothetical protein
VVDVQVVCAEVAVGPEVAERGDRGVNQARVGGGELGGIEPQAFAVADGAVLDQDVDPGQQPGQHAAAALGLEVEGDAALARIQVEEQAAALGVRAVARKRAAPPRRVAASGGLDLDDVGAEIRQQLRAVGGGDQLAHLEHREVFQESAAHSFTSPLLQLCPPSDSCRSQRSGAGHFPPLVGNGSAGAAGGPLGQGAQLLPQRLLLR